MKFKYSVGKKFTNNDGSEFKIIEQVSRRKRKIEFLDEYGYITDVYCEAIERGQIRNPYSKSIFGIGYLGVGEFIPNINGKATKNYYSWRGMLERCYSEYSIRKFKTYKNVTVCSEWHNFQNFSKWHKNNYIKIEGVNFELDKDLLQLGVENKIYSPQTCVFLPQSVNVFLANKFSNNTSGHTGVCWDKHAKKWQVSICLFGERKNKRLGRFCNIEEASASYKEAREIEAEKVKEYLRSLNYLSEEIIQLVK